MVAEVTVVEPVVALTAGMLFAFGGPVVVEGRIEMGGCWVRGLPGRVLGGPYRIWAVAALQRALVQWAGECTNQSAWGP